LEPVLDISAQLIISHNNDQFVLVAEENYIIVNFQDMKALERVTGSGGGGSSKGSSGGGLQTLQKINDAVLALKLIVDIRVGGKTYVTFGTGNSAKITAAAIFGKIGSFFGK
jgi:hypothetical protein